MDAEMPAMPPSNPLPSFDARVWARSFMDHNAVNPEIARDEETMVTWFANALMRGYDEHAHLELSERALAAPRKLTREQVRMAVMRAQYRANSIEARFADELTDDLMRLLECPAPPSEVAQTEEK